MARRRIQALFVLAALLSPPEIAAGHSHLSEDAQVNQARELIHGGRWHTALEILRPLADPAREDITDIRFLIGLSALAAAQQTENKTARNALLDEAIAALRAILVDRPHLTRVRLELARAFFLRGDDDLSRQHFERALASEPPAAMAVNIRRFLRSIRARRRWSGHFSLGVEQNDNINSGPDSETIYLFDLPFTLDKESRPRAETGLSLATGGEYQYPLSERWRWRFGIDATRNEYRGHEFDQIHILLRSGSRWLLSRDSEISLQGIGGQRWVGGRRHGREIGLRLDTRRQLTPRLGANGRASWKRIRRQQRPEAAHTEVDYALGGVYLFSPLLQGNAGLGLSRVGGGNGGGNSNRRITIGLSALLPNGWTVGGALEWSRRRHDHNAPFLPARQIDRKRAARLFLLNRGITLHGFSPQLIVARERQESNSALDSYRRTRLELRFVRQF